MSFRFWIGVWLFFYLMALVAFDLSALVRYITRFTEESFAVLISVIFIYEVCHFHCFHLFVATVRRHAN